MNIKNKTLIYIKFFLINTFKEIFSEQKKKRFSRYLINDFH